MLCRVCWACQACHVIPPPLLPSFLLALCLQQYQQKQLPLLVVTSHIRLTPSHLTLKQQSARADTTDSSSSFEHSLIHCKKRLHVLLLQCRVIFIYIPKSPVRQRLSRCGRCVVMRSLTRSLAGLVLSGDLLLGLLDKVPGVAG